MIYRLVILAGILLLIIPLVITPLASALLSRSLTNLESAHLVIFFGSFILIVLLFAAPILILGMVSPMVIALLAKQVCLPGALGSTTSPGAPLEAGRIAGKVFSFSTLGSILGVFLPIWVLIPLQGSRMTIFESAVLLIFIAAYGILGERKSSRLKALFILPIFSLSQIINIIPAFPSRTLVHEQDSRYQYVRVVENKEVRYLIFNEGLGVQTIYKLNDPLTGSYYDYFALSAIWSTSWSNTAPKDVLILGLAGGSIYKSLKYLLPAADLRVDGVEIDPAVIKVAEKWFDLKEDGHLKIYNQDGRIFLNSIDKKYDLIIVDAYTQQFYIPFQLVSKEFFNLVKERLRPGGTLATNVAVPSSESKLFNGLANTTASVFKQVYFINTPLGSGNYIVFASDSDFNFDKGAPGFRLLNLENETAITRERFNYDPGALVFTDDYAPVEFLSDKAFWKHFLDYIERK